MAISRHDSEVIALQALGWLVSQKEILGVFLGASGSDVLDLKTRADDPEFLGSVLDFILMDDRMVVDFCTSEKIDNNLPMIARQMLPGGDLPNWT